MEWLIVLLLISLSAFFSCSEIAFFSLPKEKVRSWRHSSIPNQQTVYSLLVPSRDFLVLIFFLNTVVNVLIQNVLSSLFSETSSQIWMRIVVPFVLVLFLGEYLPKYIGLQFSEKLALTSAHIFLFVKKRLERSLRWITALAENISSILFFFLKAEPPMTEKDISDILKTSENLKLVSSNEASLIRQVLEVKKSTAYDALIPMSELPKIQKFALSMQSLLEGYKKSPHHLLVITQGSSEECIGVVDASLLSHSLKEKDGTALIEKAKALLSFVPTTMHVDKLNAHFHQTKTSYAAVYDEHGKTLGIVSQRRIIEMLLPQAIFTEALVESPQIFSGTTTLDSLNDLFGTNITSEHNVKTIGGWLVEVLDEVPAIGSTYTTYGLLFRVLASDEKVVSRILVQQLKPEETT